MRNSIYTNFKFEYMLFVSTNTNSLNGLNLMVDYILVFHALQREVYMFKGIL